MALQLHSTELLEIVSYGTIPLVLLLNGIKERKVMSQFFGKRIIAKVQGIMNGFLQRLYFAAVDVVAQVIPETPYECHIRIGVLQSEEVFTAYPPCIVLVLSVECIDKEGRALPIKVVDSEVVPLVG